MGTAHRGLPRQGTTRYSTMHINKLKVKPRKTPYVQPCALELTAMLGCWASSGDLVNAKDCREAAIRLHECMAKPVRAPPLSLSGVEGAQLTTLETRAASKGQAARLVRQLPPR